jgi:hypothetical protein
MCESKREEEMLKVDLSSSLSSQLLRVRALSSFIQRCHSSGRYTFIVFQDPEKDGRL